MTKNLFLGLLVSMAFTDSVSAEQKLYVLNSHGKEVTVIDVKTNEILREITVGDGPHGIAASGAQDLLLIATEFDNTLSVIDPRTDTVTKQHKIGRRPNEIDVTSDGRYVYIPALKDGEYQVFDLEVEKTIAKMPVDGMPHNAIMSPDSRFAYFSSLDYLTTGRSKFSVFIAGYPTSTNDKIYVADTVNHKIIDTIHAGGTPRPIAINPNGKFLYVNIEGLQGFTVLDLEARKLVETVEYSLSERERAIPSRSHGLFAAPNGKHLWASDVNNGLVYLFDISQSPAKELKKIAVGSAIYWMTGTPDGKTLYVSSADGDYVTVIDTETATITTKIDFPKGSAPKRVLVLDVPEA